MNRSRSNSAGVRFGWTALLLLALAVRAMVPAGWMPSAGAVGLTFCNGDIAMPSFAEIAAHRTDGVPIEIAVARAAIDRAEGKGTPAPPPVEPHPCAFAGMAPALPGPAFVTAPLLPPTPALAPVPQRQPVAIGLGLSAPPPPATGPPALT